MIGTIFVFSSCWGSSFRSESRPTVRTRVLQCSRACAARLTPSHSTKNREAIIQDVPGCHARSKAGISRRPRSLQWKKDLVCGEVTRFEIESNNYWSRFCPNRSSNYGPAKPSQTFFQHNFFYQAPYMYPENPERTWIIVGFMNTGYDIIYDNGILFGIVPKNKCYQTICANINF